MPLYEHKGQGDGQQGDGQQGDKQPAERRRTVVGSLEDDRLADSKEWELIDESVDELPAGETSTAPVATENRPPRGPGQAAQNSAGGDES